jgi:ribosomal-protein-alanine N-acetyltransferase
MSAFGVCIEPAGQQHVPAVQLLAADPAIAATSNVPHPYPTNGATEWVRRATEGRERGTLFAFVIVEAADGVVGVCSLMGVSMRFRVAGLGYWVGRPYWGRGYATEGARQVLEFGFRELELTRVEAGALDHNLASVRVLQKLGFIATDRSTMHEKGGGRHYLLERSAWNAQQNRHEH